MKKNYVLNFCNILATCKDSNLMTGEECTCIYPYYFDIAKDDQNCINCEEGYWLNKDIINCEPCSNPKCRVCIDSSQ